VGDVVVEVAGNPVTTMPEMVAELMRYRPGDLVDMMVIRGEHTVVCHVVLRETDSAG